VFTVEECPGRDGGLQEEACPYARQTPAVEVDAIAVVVHAVQIPYNGFGKAQVQDRDDGDGEHHDGRAAVGQHHAHDRDCIRHPFVGAVPLGVGEESQIRIVAETPFMPERPAKRRRVDGSEAGRDERDGRLDKQGDRDRSGVADIVHSVAGQIRGVLSGCPHKGCGPNHGHAVEEKGWRRDVRHDQDEDSCGQRQERRAPGENESHDGGLTNREVSQIRLDDAFIGSLLVAFPRHGGALDGLLLSDGALCFG